MVEKRIHYLSMIANVSTLLGLQIACGLIILLVLRLALRGWWTRRSVRRTMLVVLVLDVALPVLWFLLGAWMMSIQFVDYPMDNHGIRFREVRNKLSQRRLTSLGFGGTVAVWSQHLFPGRKDILASSSHCREKFLVVVQAGDSRRADHAPAKLAAARLGHHRGARHRPRGSHGRTSR